MKVLGIVAEYNPFHNGHIYHIQKAKELVKPDYTVVVMSGNFVQRGDMAIIDKWERAKIALKYGVDLVIELPFVYAVQSADYFAKGAIQLLNAIGVTDLVFGSEDGHIENFTSIAYAIKNNQSKYDEYVKEYMNQGYRYPNATNEALIKIMDKEVRTPNDLLGLAYVKEIIQNDYSMTPHCIKRTNDYHSESLEKISSATALRIAIRNNQSITEYLPFPEAYKDIYCLECYYPYIKYILSISSKDSLKEIHMVNEGLENKLKTASKEDSLEDCINHLLSKRYTKPRIQRMLIHVLLQNTKQEIASAMNIDYLRVLAMNDHGREYLNKIKKVCDYHIITNFSNYKHPALDIEMKAAKLLSLSHPEIEEKEYKTICYIKEDSLI